MEHRQTAYLNKPLVAAMQDPNPHPSDHRTTDDDALDVDRFYHGYPLAPDEPGYLETVMIASKDERRILLVFADRTRVFDEDAGWTTTTDVPQDAEGFQTQTSRHSSHAYMIMMKSSDDGGRSWSDERPLLDETGDPLRGFHVSPVRLRSGRIGLVYSAHGVPGGHPGRNYGTVMAFRTSDDEGRTWSAARRIDSHFALCPSGHALVMSNGRIVAPAFRWISPLPGNDAEAWTDSWDGYEGAGATLSYSYAYVSDDEGETWDASLSELFISISRAAYDLEEPTVVELNDGRLLMHMRSQLGRLYRSFSDDGGTSWSTPEALQIASSYAPQFLTRMPTGDLLMVWSQSSRQEIMMGLSRHRLSCAVSQDEGQTWGQFKMLESLDQRAEVSPPPQRLAQSWSSSSSTASTNPATSTATPAPPAS